MTDLRRRSAFPASLAAAAVLIAGGCVEPTSQPTTSKAPQSGTIPPSGSSSSSAKNPAGSASSGKKTPVSLPPPSPTKKPNPKDYGKIKENSLDGAEWAATYYLDAIGYGYATGDTSILKAWASNDCNACTTFIGRVEDLKSKQEYGVDATFRYAGYSSRRLSEKAFSVTVKIEENDFKVVNTATKNVESQKGKDYSVKIVPQKQENGWKILEMGPAK